MRLRKKKAKVKKPRKTNSRTRSERNERDTTALARARVLKEARRVGVISNKRACQVGRVSQAWYHLNALVKAGQLKRVGYNQWMPR